MYKTLNGKIVEMVEMVVRQMDKNGDGKVSISGNFDLKKFSKIILKYFFSIYLKNLLKTNNFWLFCLINPFILLIKIYESHELFFFLFSFFHLIITLPQKRSLIIKIAAIIMIALLYLFAKIRIYSDD